MISTQYKNILVALSLFATTSYSNAESVQLRGGATTNENTLDLPTLRRTVTKRSRDNRLRQNRKLGGGNWCPSHFPGSGTSCSLSGYNFGTCYYSSSAPEGNWNYDPQACSCNHDGKSIFECWKMDSYDPKPDPEAPPSFAPPTKPSAPTKSPVAPPTKHPTKPSAPTKSPVAPPTKAPTEPVSPTSAPDDNVAKYCPEFLPTITSSCAIKGMTCYWSSSAQEGEEPNRDPWACSCDKNNQFSCRGIDSFPEEVTSKPIEHTDTPVFNCPDYVPSNDSTCPLSGNWVGTCYWSSSHQEGELPNNDARECSCNKDGKSKFSCHASTR